MKKTNSDGNLLLESYRLNFEFLLAFHSYNHYNFTNSEIRLFLGERQNTVGRGDSTRYLLYIKAGLPKRVFALDDSDFFVSHVLEKVTFFQKVTF